MPKMKILMLNANPSDECRIRTDREAREIEEALRRGRNRDGFEIRTAFAVRPEDLRRRILDEKPHIVHFSGHGCEDGSLVFENAGGAACPAPPEAVAELFRILSDGVACVVLNACYSKAQAEAIARHIPHVVGMNDSINDGSAIAFSVGFYDGLVGGTPIPQAFALGKNAIHMNGLPGHDIPELLTIRGSVPDEEGESETNGCVWQVPYPQNPYFTGRDDDLRTLEESLAAEGAAAISQSAKSAHGKAALSGLGGVGKTQTALEYCHRHKDDYAAVLWLRAETPETLAPDVTQAAKLLELPGADAKEQEIVFAAFKTWLETNHNWLLVLDNVDTEAMLGEVKNLLPTALGGHTLITSRLHDFAPIGIGSPMEMETLPEEDAVQLLLKRSGQPEANSEAVLALARELGCLPLALSQAAAYIKKTRRTFEAYLDRYRALGLEILGRGQTGDSDYSKTVATTWKISFDQVMKVSPKSANLLDLCAFFAPEAIPDELLIAAIKILLPKAEGKDDEMLCDEGHELLAVAAEYSLLQSEPESFSMHRLVQSVARQRLGNDQKTQAEKAVQALNSAFPYVKLETWPLCDRLLPHALACFDHIEAFGLASEETARLLNHAGYYLNERARFAMAEPLCRRALDIDEKAYGSKHPHTAASLNNLAAPLRAQGKLEEAEPRYRRALDIREAVLGPDHPDTATSLNNLAALLESQGKYDDAEPLFRRALDIDEKAYGSEHPEVATSLNNLAALLESQGKFEEAEPLCRRALDIREAVLGPDHPLTAASLNNLATLLRAQGKYDDAEPLYRRALDIDEKAYGSEHPEVATSLNNLAALLKSQGKLDDAEPLYRRALDVREAVLGPDHPHIAASLNNLAALLKSQGKFDDAEPLFLRALDIREKLLGLEHFHTAKTMGNLAGLYHAQGKLDQAESLNRCALGTLARSLGPEHPNTLKYHSKYISLLRDMSHPTPEAQADAVIAEALKER